MVDWSNLPEELLNFIAGRLFSAVELKRFRSICKSWRSSVPGTGPFPGGPIIHFNPIPESDSDDDDDIFEPGAFLSRAAFFRVTLSCSPRKGWLIKSDVDINSGRFRLLQALSRRRLRRPLQSLDLLKFTVTEIRESYAVLYEEKGKFATPRFIRSALVKVKKGEDHHYGDLGISRKGKITYWDGHVLRTKFENMAKFSDIIVHKGLTYVLDSQGIVWLINSDLEISKYGPSLDEIITNGCYGIMRFVECGNELYIVERLPKENPRKRKAENDEISSSNITVGFKVYKMDEELGKWTEVKTLGDYAFMIDSEETCFSVLAHEFYGCVENSIYFTENTWIKMYKLDNGNDGIVTEAKSKSSFEMFHHEFHQSYFLYN